jgi:outer membrane protein OmpA-like peptidoglycan-associated protein
MLTFSRGWLSRTLIPGLALMLLVASFSSPAGADDCRRIPNILVLFDASGFMKDKWDFFLQQMAFFQQAMPLTRDGFFNVGIRDYGLKVGLGCENTESILAIQPWDPERFFNAFPKNVSYGVSSLSAGLRAAGDEVASADGKSIIVLVGGGIESCNLDPVKVTDQMCKNNPDLEIHTFQIGNAPEGNFYLKAIAQRSHGTYNLLTDTRSSASWHAWMKKNLVMPCASSAAPQAPPAIGPVLFDSKGFSVRSNDPAVDVTNLQNLDAVAQILRGNPSAKVVLHGFSDAKGNPDFNMKLSKKRAEAVAHFLIRTYHISSTRISVVPHGSSQAALQTPAAQQRGARRVEFEITYH